MSQCISIYGHLGRVIVKGCTFLGDPVVHPAWVWPNPPGGIAPGPDPIATGVKEGDGGHVMTTDDTSKGAPLNAHGYSTNELVIDDWTSITDLGESAYMRLGGAEVTRFITRFNFRQTAFKPYIALLNDTSRENGILIMTAGGTAPGALYNYGSATTTEGWHPGTLPPSVSGQEWRIWYKGAKIGTGQSGTPTVPAVFPNGYKQQTFDDLQAGKIFSVLL